MNRSEDLSLGSAVVTGADGFIGRVLRERLGLSAVSFTDKATVDVSRPSELVERFRGFQIIVHLASLYREGPMTPARAALSVRLARNVMTAAKEAGVERVVLLSSIRAAPMPSSWTGREHELNWPLVYSRACHAKERLGARGALAGLDVITVRPGRVSWPDWHGSGLERAVWLSHEDCASLFRRCLLTPLVPRRHVIMSAVSAQSVSVHDTSNPIGWAPETTSLGLKRRSSYGWIQFKTYLKGSRSRLPPG